MIVNVIVRIVKMANFLILALVVVPSALSDVSKQAQDLVTTARVVFLALGLRPARPVQVDSDNQTVEPATACHAFRVNSRIVTGAKHVTLAHQVNFKEKRIRHDVTCAQQVGTRKTMQVQIASSVVPERSNKQREKKHANLAQVGNLQTSLQCLCVTTARWDLLRQAKRTLSVFPAAWEHFKVRPDKANVYLVRQGGCRREWAPRSVQQLQMVRLSWVVVRLRLQCRPDHTCWVARKEPAHDFKRVQQDGLDTRPPKTLASPACQARRASPVLSHA